MSRMGIAALFLLLSVGTAASAPRVHGDAAPAVYRDRPSKPTGPIAVEYRLAAAPAVGVPLAITITARVAGAAGALGLETTATEPRAVLLTVPTPIAGGDGLYVWQITVVPLVPNAGYLDIVVAGEIDGVAQARTVTISLRSDGEVAVRAGPSVRGEALIELPVRETP